MPDVVLSVDNLSKSYQLGSINTGTFYGDLKRWWARQRGNPDPYQRIGEADHFTRQGETLWALKDINFQVRQGEALGIIGRNGAGKSTLLKILSQVTAPTSGLVKVKGRIASLLEVGTGFHPELTGRENIYLNGAIMGMSRAEVARKFDEIVDFSGVEKYIDTPVKRYSSGMYVRLAFSVAAHLEPEILVVDEVLAVGDAEFQKKCLGKMSDVAHKGRTVLFVSHNMGAIQYLCNCALLLSHGELVYSGESDIVINRYISDIETITQQDLKSRTDRSGNQRLKFTQVNLEDKNGDRVQEMISGKDYSIVLSYVTNGPVRNAVISIGFYGSFGQFLLMCNNEMAGTHFEMLPSTGTVKCTLPHLPFAQGIYHINLYCEVNGIQADWVQEAAVITVVDGDFYGTGKGSPTTHGGFLASQSWSQFSEE